MILELPLRRRAPMCTHLVFTHVKIWDPSSADKHTNQLRQWELTWSITKRKWKKAEHTRFNEFTFLNRNATSRRSLSPENPLGPSVYQCVTITQALTSLSYFSLYNLSLSLRNVLKTELQRPLKKKTMRRERQNCPSATTRLTSTRASHVRVFGNLKWTLSFTESLSNT